MKVDPHEAGQRMSGYVKALGDEEFFEAVNQALASAPLPRTTAPTSKLPLIYVVGAPRSGTTLLSQLLSRHLPVGYINNLIARFWLRPSVGIRLSNALLGCDGGTRIELMSRLGTTADLVGPHEFGYFWRHWLKLDEAATHNPTPEDLGRIDAAGLADALVGEILGSFNRPVVVKNVICGFYAPFLSTIHERSLFVHIERDPLVTAVSILKSRLERYGSYDNWWSLKPSTYPFEGARCPEEQVVRQVLDSRKQFEVALGRPGVQAIHLSYESLCNDPGREIDRIAAAISAWTPGFSRRSGELEPLRPSTRLELPEAMMRRVVTALNDARA